MIFKATKLSGVYVIEPEKIEDERGFFAHTWSRTEFEKHSLEVNVMESNISFNRIKGTLRGMHYQAEPYGQTKLVRCTRGSIYDVGVDLRKDSETFKQWVGVKLSAENRLMLYLPQQFAHGYLTLEDDTEVHYQVTRSYFLESARGFRWDDPAFGIQWPALDTLKINKRDREYPDYKL